jgi:tRNA dimethylallyltransferase
MSSPAKKGGLANLTRPPLVIVGPTASGKSALALSLAKRLGHAHLVSADSMSVYEGMDIGTAKASQTDRVAVPHHLVDVVLPSDEFTVSQFRERVFAVLETIEQSGDTPIMVGGTGLYVQAVVDNFTMPPQFPDIARELEAEANTGALWDRLHQLDSTAAAKMEPTNRRRIVRALEVCLGSGRPFSSFGPGVDASPPTRFALAGLEITREQMDANIASRYSQQMKDGFLEEVAGLRDAIPPMSRTARQALGYRELLAHLDGECTLDEALEEAKKRTRRFARRQQRWFRRDPRIRWFDAEANDLVDQVENWWGDLSDS